MKKLAIVLMVGILSGCATQSFNISNNSEQTPTADEMQSFFVYGLGQTKEIDAASICGGTEKVAKIETSSTFLNNLLGSLTFGIYAPRQAKIYCTK